jgi:hypothetical protein
VCYREYNHFFVEDTVDNAKRELMQNISAAAGEICGPALGSFRDSRDRTLKFAFKI